MGNLPEGPALSEGPLFSISRPSSLMGIAASLAGLTWTKRVSSAAAAAERSEKFKLSKNIPRAVLEGMPSAMSKMALHSLSSTFTNSSLRLNGEHSHV